VRFLYRPINGWTIRARLHKVTPASLMGFVALDRSGLPSTGLSRYSFSSCKPANLVLIPEYPSLPEPSVQEAFACAFNSSAATSEGKAEPQGAQAFQGASTDSASFRVIDPVLAEGVAPHKRGILRCRGFHPACFTPPDKCLFCKPRARNGRR